MESITYIGELLWPGLAGQLAVILAFVGALAGSIAYLRAVGKPDSTWRRLGRVYFGVHGVAVLGMIGLLLFLMIGERYEYSYVWQHVSSDLPTRYIFSAFWEGQEGSFLLWLFWHVILGGILVFKGGKWESPVMAVLLAVQAIIAAMLLGIYFSESVKIGINPFMMLRDTMQAPIFAREDYLSMIEGSGLSPLLQNYWMTIHPPTLFLGFASVTVPFAYAIAGLITREHRAWLKAAMPWALFSAGILGTGILMGSAWAYEALTFGGYWAWDPVENMSLVPWIVLVAGIHANLIGQRTGYSIRTAYLFYILSFLGVLYSTFLTRSGVLGDTSAHAFTQMGLEWQLVALIVIFAALSAYLLARNWKQIPVPEREEKLESREFWMFIGTLVLLFSAALITFTTSIPVYNKILAFTENTFGISTAGLHRDPPVDTIAHYNRFQLWIAVFIGLLSGLAQFLRYKEPSWSTHRKQFVRQMALYVLLAGGLTALLTLWIEARAWQYILLLGCASFAVIANSAFLWRYARDNASQAASGMAHLGFAMMIIGIMASGLNKHILSSNPFAQAGLVDGLDPATHITLIKDRPMYMNGYWVEYERDSIQGNSRVFSVKYSRIDQATGDTIESFTLHPDILFNNKLTKVEASNPATKHYLTRDIFTYVAALPGEQMDIEEARRIQDTLNFRKIHLFPGDTLRTPEFAIWLEDLRLQPASPEYTPRAGDLPLEAEIGILGFTESTKGKTYQEEVLLYLRDGLVYGYPTQINDLNLRVRLSDEAIRQIYQIDDTLEFQELILVQDEEKRIGDYRIRLVGIDREASDPLYTPQDGDIALNAILQIRNGEETIEARPLYYIRGSRQNNIPTFIPETGMQIRFESIAPQSQQFYFRIAFVGDQDHGIAFEYADNVPRNDIIVLEAIVFPGIKLFWVGAILMMAGLFLGMWTKRKRRSV